MGSLRASASDTHTIALNEHQSRNKNFVYPAVNLSTEDTPYVEVQKDAKHVLILGAGVSGLMIAWMLLDKGYRVTIVAEHWAWNKDFAQSRITSQIAGALWEYPPGGCGLTEIESPGSGWSNIDHYREWSLQSFEFFSKYTKVANDYEKSGHSFGLQLTKLHQFFWSDAVDGPPSDGEVRNEELDKFRALQAESSETLDKYGFELGIETCKGVEEIKAKFPNVNTNIGGEDFQSSYSHVAPIINTDKATAYLMALVKAKGASLETRKFDGKVKDFGKQLLEDHEAHLIVNATGLGARELADDPDVYPVRGAIKRIDNTRSGRFRHLNDAYLAPAQRDSKNRPTKTIFIVPRNDDVLYVGSIIQPNNNVMNLTPDSPEVEVMWNRAIDFLPSLANANTFPGFPFAQGLRPFTRRNVKVRADEDANFPLVHNYGHGGSGWTLGVGTARCAVLIVEELLVKKSSAEEINLKLYGKRDKKSH